MIVKMFFFPSKTGIEGLLIMVLVTMLVALTGACLVCAAIWYRVEREMEWCLVTVAAAGAMGITVGIYGLCVFFVVPTTYDHALQRASTGLRADFDSYDLSQTAQFNNDNNSWRVTICQ